MKKIILLSLILGLTTSCVSKKIFTDLETKFADLKKENRRIQDENEALLSGKTKAETDGTALQTALDKLKTQNTELQADLDETAKNLKQLQAWYKDLEKNSSESIKENMAKNKDLIAKLEAKEKALADEEAKFNKTKSDLAENSKRLQELEAIMAAKEASMKKLKETLSKALNGFEGKGLTVEQKNGKVYVSMENKLLFGSGSWAVGTEGRKAVVEVAKVLGANPEIAILIEGHTDDDAISGSGPVADNWDLSTKRATAIVNIISENKAVNKQNLTAAGRSEFAPIAPNTTPEGKAKNRRIEIILTPKLDEISKMLNEI
jgi:chemotaxis protein MotB